MGVCKQTGHVTINLDSADLASKKAEEIEELLNSALKVTIQVPIRHCSSYLDMISDYLDASYAFETLAKLGTTSILRRVSAQSSYSSLFEIDISGFSSANLSYALKSLSLAVRYPENDEVANSQSFNQIRDSVLRHEFEMLDTPLRFPDIVEDYFSNLINGAYYECGRTTFGHQLNDYPEREYLSLIHI